MDRTEGRLFLAGLTLGLAVACASSPAQKRDESKRAMQYFRLAQVDFAQGQNQEAITHLKQAISLDPKNADVHNYLGVVYLLLSDYANAEKELDESLKLNPYLTDARNSLGAVYMKTNRAERARTYFEEALKDRTYPTPERIYYNLGTLELGEKRYPAAMQVFRRAVEANPNYVKGYFGLGLVFQESGQTDDARVNFQKVISLDPKSPEAARAREHLARISPGSKG